jgi:predicted AlkP superfamily phosphohydrolase/phosphomutase/tetratricopeptide (TPR) repeat protein
LNQKLIFVGWDAADWKAINPLMDAGRMPHLRSLVERGVMGRVATLNPPLSPMLWTSIATGKRPFKHGIHGFSEPTPDGRGIRPVTNLSRTSKAVWNIFNQNGLRSIVIGWWPSQPAEPINGVMVSDQYHRAFRPLGEDGIASWPLPPNAVYPPELHQTLAELRMHPQELAGAMVEAFIPLLAQADQEKDRRVSMLCKIIAECVSIHCAATWLIENQPWDFFAVYYDAIDHFCHGFMKYHPPRQPWISERDFELYSNVISTAYRFHDQMLGTLLSKAPADTRVALMSDHGFHPDHLRPRAIPDIPAGPAIEHSPYGILVLSGQGIKRDERIYGASVLDVAPTLLALCGLPVGADMDGRVLTNAFEDPPDVAVIPSWEDVPGEDGRHPPDTRLDPIAAAEALEQLAALGYIEKPGANAERNVECTVRELRYNLVEAYQDANRHGDAIGIARDLCVRNPDEQRYALKRFLSCQALGFVGEMREIVDDMDGRRRALYEEAVEKMKPFRDLAAQRFDEKKAATGQTADPGEREREIAYELDPRANPEEPREPLLEPDERAEMEKWRNLIRYQPALADYLQAQVLTAEKRWFEALTALQRIRAVHLARPGLLLQAAELYRRLGRAQEAESTYRAALDIDPDNAHGYLGLARVALRRRDFAAARESALNCLQRLYFYPMAHFVLGVALAGLREDERSAEAFRVALLQNPHFPQAHLWLARLLRFRFKDRDAAEEHFRYYRAMRRRKPASSVVQDAPRERAVAERVAARLETPLPPLGDAVFVVSGLPRSGTSMAMQMLNAGGMPILTDGLREADEDNPRGYYEYETVKKMFREPNWIGEARGKAVKIVAPLVCALPAGHDYRVLLIERDFGEILDSQARMIVRRGEAVPDSPERRERLEHEYARVIEQTKRTLSARRAIEFLAMRYEDILRDPIEAACQIAFFAGGGMDAERMAEAVDPSLYRRRRI